MIFKKRVLTAINSISITITIVLCYIMLAGCASESERAQLELKKREIPFTNEAFAKQVAFGNIEPVKLFITAGKDVNLIYDKNVNYLCTVTTSLLHSASEEGHKEIVDLLSSKGAKVNGRDSLGNTPLHYASEKGHKEIVELLVYRGADVNAKNKSDVTPLHEVCMQEVNKKEIAEFLIINGADVNAKVIDCHWTPLFFAVNNGHKEIAELLIISGADVNAKSEEDVTPLHTAVMRGQFEIVGLLISRGADVNAMTRHPFTPLDLAKDKEIIELLESHGAKRSDALSE